MSNKQANEGQLQGQSNRDATNQQEQANRQPGAIQRGQQRQRGGLARRGEYFPSLFSLNPGDLFSASPFELMRRFTDEMDRAFSGFGLSSGFGAGQSEMWAPAVEVFRRGNNLVVRAELPGLNKEDVRVELTDDGLVIQGERRREHDEEQEGFYRSERSYGRFYRVIPMPDDVSEEQISAQFKDGVLEVSMPAPERQQKRREIPIEAGGVEQPQAAKGTSTKS